MKYTELNDCEEFYHKVEYYNKTKTEQLSYHYKEILKLLGEDPDREGLVKLPTVWQKAMQFMTRGVSRESGGNSAVGTFQRRLPPDGYCEKHRDLFHV